MSLDDTKTVRVSDQAHQFLTAMAEKNHVSVAFLVDFMLGRTINQLEDLFSSLQKVQQE